MVNRMTWLVLGAGMGARMGSVGQMGLALVATILVSNIGVDAVCPAITATGTCDDGCRTTQGGVEEGGIDCITTTWPQANPGNDCLLCQQQGCTPGVDDALCRTGYCNPSTHLCECSHTGLQGLGCYVSDATQCISGNMDYQNLCACDMSGGRRGTDCPCSSNSDCLDQNCVTMSLPASYTTPLKKCRPTGAPSQSPSLSPVTHSPTKRPTTGTPTIRPTVNPTPYPNANTNGTTSTSQNQDNGGSSTSPAFVIEASGVMLSAVVLMVVGLI